MISIGIMSGVIIALSILLLLINATIYKNLKEQQTKIDLLVQSNYQLMKHYKFFEHDDYRYKQ